MFHASAFSDPALWYTFILLFTTGAMSISIFSIWWVTSEKRRLPIPVGKHAPISVLKPLCGVDEDLEANLETFFHLTYPDFELIFGVAGDTDPAIEVVKRLKTRYPTVKARLIVHDGQRGLNPKVANLRAMLEKGAHDVVVISDSNIRVDPDYLDEMYGQLLDEGVEMVTSLISGQGEESLGAALENLHLTGYVSPIKAGAKVLGIPFVIGKSVMFRRSVFDALGGFEALSNVLGEDYVMGQMVQLAGYEVRVASKPVRNVSVNIPLSRFVMRHLRWGLIRTRCKPFLYAVEPLGSPAVVAFLAPFFDVDLTWPLLWAVALTGVRDVSGWVCLRGAAGLQYALALGFFKELFTLAIWLVAPFTNHVTWRGKRYRVDMGTHLYAESPMMAPGEVREYV